MVECIERANLIARIKYYITHTPEGWGEHYAYSVALNEVLNCPAADVVQPVQWIPVAERLPKPETEVMIVCNRNGYRFIATAIHEDGTLLTEDSNWNWNDIWGYGLYDEEHDDYIIPEGWWESRCFTPDDVYNCPVDCEVTHWMPMPELPKEENNGNQSAD